MPFLRKLKPHKYWHRQWRERPSAMMPDKERSAAAGFNVGQSPIYLPFFTVTLLHTPKHPPSYAKFEVPLNLNKFDMRDYLFHAYGVRTRNVRSYIKLSKIMQGKPHEEHPKPGNWYRPKSKKFMFVELEKPFVWPAVPEDFSLWDKEAYDAANPPETRREVSRNTPREDPSMDPPEGRSELRQQARQLMAAHMDKIRSKKSEKKADPSPSPKTAEKLRKPEYKDPLHR